MKNLADAPVRLQRMLLRLQDYDFTLKYRPGEEMAIADALSRYSPEDAPEIHLDISINHVYITDEKKQDYQKAIQDDPLLHALADIIVSGWPEDIKDVPKSLRPYHGQRNMLTVEDGIILRGEAIVIPPRREEEGTGTTTPRTSRNIEVPEKSRNNAYTGLASAVTSNDSWNLALHARSTDPRNQGNH